MRRTRRPHGPEPADSVPKRSSPGGRARTVRIRATLSALALGGCAAFGYPSGSTPDTSANAAAAGRPRAGTEAARPATASPASGADRAPADFRRDRAPTRDGGVDLDTIPDAVPRDEPRSRYGNPREYEVFGRTYRPLESSDGYEAEGVASWYGEEFHGRPTSSGEPYDMYAMTAAHTTLPLPTYLEVVNLDNGGRVVVRVNDRGPFHDGRLIDLSYAAAWRLGMIGAGTARVRVRALRPGS